MATTRIPRVLIVALNGIEARRVFTQDWLLPGPAKEVRAITMPSSFSYELRYHKEHGLPMPTLWIGRRNAMNDKRVADILEMAKQNGVECKSFKQHENFRNWPLRMQVDPDFDLMHRPMYFMVPNVNIGRTVLRVDLDMPSQFEKRVCLVMQRENLIGVDGKDRVLWVGPALHLMRPGTFDDLMAIAYHRGFELRQYEEHPMYSDPRSN